MKRLSIIICFIFIQITLSLVMGYVVLSANTPSNVVNGGVFYAGTELSGKTIPLAAEEIESLQAEMINEGYARFTYFDDEFMFKYTDIALTVSASNIEASLNDSINPYLGSNLLTANLRRYSGKIAPRLIADIDKFRQKLLQIKEYIDIEPVDANIECLDTGEIFRTQSDNGYEFDVDGEFERIFRDFCDKPFEAVVLDIPYLLPSILNPDNSRTGALIKVLPPAVDYSLLKDVDTLLAETVVTIPESLDAVLVAKAAAAVDKIWVPKNGAAAGPFSLLRYFKEEGLPSDKPYREYDFVATAMLKAYLSAGGDYSKVDAVKSNFEDDFDIIKGFGVAVIADGTQDKGTAEPTGGDGVYANTDFKFTNTLGSNIVVFTKADEGRITVKIAGNAKYAGTKSAPHSIDTVMKGNKVFLVRDGKNLAHRDLS